MKIKFCSLMAVILGAVALPAAAGDMDAIVADCNGCHGDNGVSQWTDVPTIAGISEAVHADNLFVYLDEARPCKDSEYKQGPKKGETSNMCKEAAAVGEDMIEDVAAHYAELPFVPAKQDFDAALAETGKGIHEAQCDRCHSDGGANPDDDASILSGQWMGYMERTFAEYRADKRDQPSKMKEKLDALSDDDVKALVHYYASQQ